MEKDREYMPDLFKTSLDEFKNVLKTGRLLPSRKPLLVEIDGTFSKLQNANITNVSILRENLKSTEKIQNLVQITGIPETYFKLLKREVNNLLPTPIKFCNVPNITENILIQLDKLNIKDTEYLFPFIKDVNSRLELSRVSGLPEVDVLSLTKLVDVSRIKWVGPKLARLIVDTKYDTVEKLAKADPVDVLEALNDAKEKHKSYDGPLGINDIDSWIRQVVRNTPLIISY